MARVENRRSTYTVLVRTLHGRRSLGRPRRKWEDNIKIYVQNGDLEGMD
jgi:hypothetical protein